MPDLEIVIKGLECRALERTAECDDCRYNDSWQRRCMTAQIAMDALELLRTRVPRVMTLEEIEEVEVVWLEDKNEPLILPALCIGRNDYDDERRVGFNITYKNGLYDCKSIHPLKSEYLVRWRAWSERPTDEQRNGEKWI